MTTDEEGAVLVSGRLLAEIVRSLPARPVDLATDGTRATLKCGSATFTLVLLPEEEYPTLPEMPPFAGSVGSDAMASAIGQVAIAAGRDDTLPALTGIRIEITGDTLTLVATDRYRLAVRELRWNPAQPDLNTAVLVPARVLGDTARALTSGAEVSISLGGDSLIGFAGAGLVKRDAGSEEEARLRVRDRQARRDARAAGDADSRDAHPRRRRPAGDPRALQLTGRDLEPAR